MQRYELAQLNVAVMNEPLESPGMADFVDNLDRINAMADQAPGFVWRLQTDEGDATALRPFGPEMLINISVWKDIDSMKSFVYDSMHADIMRRRREWFERLSKAYLVLWWVPEGHRPTLEEAETKLGLLRGKGPTQEAFNFGHPFPPPDSPG